MNRLHLVLMLVLIATLSRVEAQQTFTNLNELLAFVDTKNISLQQGNIRVQQAKKAILAAKINVADPVLNTTSSVTDNTTLPINFFPAEAFGGAPGTFREVQTGVQYVTNLNQYAEIKLLNLGAWENMKLADLNVQSTESDNRLTLKQLYENVASTYFNIVSLQAQLASNEENIAAAETLLRVVTDKYGQGLVKQQDVNEAKASLLNTQENSRQIAFLIAQNELSLKILCDIPESESISIVPEKVQKPTFGVPQILLNDLEINNKLLKEKYAYTNLRQLKKSQYPTVSFVASNTFQRNASEFSLYNSDTRWVTSNYVGLKLNMNLPSVKLTSQIQNAQFDYQLAQKNTERSRIQSDLKYQQLKTEYDKAASQASAYSEVYDLRADTYAKNIRLYEEGLIGIDQTINSFNTKVNAHYSLISSQINVQLSQARIDINNQIK